MNGFLIDVMDSDRLFTKKAGSSRMDPSFKVDEGYSEDTRSQDGLESPMRVEAAAPEQVMPAPVVASLPEGIMALNEVERSGRAYCVPPNTCFQRVD